MQVQVFDFRWRQETPAVPQFFCEFEAHNGQKFGRKRLWIGDSLSLEPVGPVSCAGFVENDTWRPCPRHSTGKPKCEFCRSIEGNFVYTAFDGFDQSQLEPSDLDKINGEHWVYLAYFGENIIKVGVSKDPRKFLRQVEQGSAATLFIARTPDGVSARQLETLLRRGGLNDKVKASQKREFLCPDTKNAEKNLINILENHQNSLDSHPHLKDFLIEPEFHTWQDLFGLRDFTDNLHHLKLTPGEWVSGEIVAIKGPFLIIQTPEEFVSICAKDLRGYQVEFDPKPAGINLNSALQSALF